MSIPEFLEAAYQQALIDVGSNDNITSDLDEIEKAELNVILEYSEKAKAVMTVTFTSIVYKIHNSKQDIRKHQDSIENGYSGRSFDNKFITPFLKHKKFPSMAESGWLTRSLEQKVVYDKKYPGAIKPDALKVSFLNILDNIENGADCKQYLNYLLQGLIIQRNRQTIDLAKPTALSIGMILEVLKNHFFSQYSSEGASRLPVLAVYAIYECLVNETKRFVGKRILPIESHTSADSRSGRIGDIDVTDEETGREFEAVEIKFNMPISFEHVVNAFNKFKSTPVSRYYILSNIVNPSKEENEAIFAEISKIKNIHGCQVIVNGIIPTLKYYLRLLENPYEFIDKYVNLLNDDKALKFEHKSKWNEIISSLS